MKKQEMLKIISLICVSYPNLKNDEETVRNMAKMWYEVLGNEDAEKVLSAVREHIENNKFIPTIADIKEKMKPKLTAFSDNDYSDGERAERISRGITDEKYEILNATVNYPKEERQKILKEIFGWRWKNDRERKTEKSCF